MLSEYDKKKKPQGGRSRSITYHLLTKSKRRKEILNPAFSVTWNFTWKNLLNSFSLWINYFPPYEARHTEVGFLFWALWGTFSMRRHPSFKNHAHDNKWVFDVIKSWKSDICSSFWGKSSLWIINSLAIIMCSKYAIAQSSWHCKEEAPENSARETPCALGTQYSKSKALGFLQNHPLKTSALCWVTGLGKGEKGG